MATATAKKLTAKDFDSGQVVRWCPGCGDYSILAQVRKVMADLGLPREKVVIISGIGCSSRFPYYMNTYGVHSIHGRALTLATGLRVARPDLSVWVATGDGDALAIGGNHFLHALRRNIDLNIILFDNRIYGLTKGQYSPTSVLGQRTRSSPLGTVEDPVNPLCVAIGAEASFIARSVDVDIKHLQMVLRRAAEHKGTSFVEVLQECRVFNPGAYTHLSDKSVRDDNILYLEHGKPLILASLAPSAFVIVVGDTAELVLRAVGARGIRLIGLRPEVVQLGNGFSEADLLVHDEKAAEPTLAYMLARMRYPEFPEPMGVFRCVERPTLEQRLEEQIEQAVREQGEGDLEQLFTSGDVWTVEP